MDLFTLVARLGMDTSEYDSKIGKARSSFMQLGNTVSAKAVAFGQITAQLITKAANMSVEFGKSTIQAAADVEAEKAQFVATFGEMQGAADKAFKNIEKSTGVFGTRLKNVGTKAFSQFKGAGLDGVDALGMMERYTNLAADAAAYYDISLEDADARLRSFLRGNTEAGDAIGLFTSESQRNTYAMEEYGKKWLELTEAQKQMLMLNVSEDIYKQSGAIGQAKRESGAWTNVIGNLKEVWRQASAAFGSPIMAVITPKIQEFTEWISGEGVQLKIEQFGTGVANKLNAAFDWALNPTIPTWDDIQIANDSIFSGINEGLKKAIDWTLLAAGFPADSQVSKDLKGMSDSFFSLASSLGSISILSFEKVTKFIKIITGGGDGSEDTVSNISQFFLDAGNFVNEYSGPISGLIATVTAFWAISNPFHAILAGLIQLASNWKDVKDWTDKTLKATQDFFKQKIVNPISGALSTIGKWFETIIGKANAASEAIANFFGIQRSDDNPTQSTDEYFAPPSSIGGEYDNGWNTGYETHSFGGGTSIGTGNGRGFATGLDYVPHNNFYARLHEGERIMTKAENMAYSSGGVQVIDYAAMGAAVGGAVRDALDGIRLYTDDGTAIADLVTERVSRNIERKAWSERFA